jgi:hypothetical protein
MAMKNPDGRITDVTTPNLHDPTMRMREHPVTARSLG